ncbi:MAG: universal stress protein [Clostridia bacterium]|nr:universal stress protein [Clostridia bacterium]
MIQRILIACDGSDGALRAVRAATDLARRLEGARVRVVYAAPPVLSTIRRELSLVGVDVGAVIGSAGRATLQPALDLLEQAGVPHDERVVVGEPAAAITQAADEWNADLIVVGRRGHGPVGEWILGSVSHALLQRARRTVLLVP